MPSNGPESHGVRTWSAGEFPPGQHVTRDMFARGATPQPRLAPDLEQLLGRIEARPQGGGEAHE